MRVIAGDLAGAVGPGSTHTPICLMHASITAGSPARAAVEPRLQLADVRPRRLRRGRPRAPTGPHRSTRHLRPRSVAERTVQRTSRPAFDEYGSAISRGRANRRTCRTLRPVRHEHPGRDRPGRGGFPGRPARSDTAQRPDASRSRSRPGTNGTNRNLTSYRRITALPWRLPLRSSSRICSAPSRSEVEPNTRTDGAVR